VKHLLEEQFSQYKGLIRRFRDSLDLMSQNAYENLDDHFSDAAAFARAIKGSVPLPHRILDLGSGVGLPGVVIAILLPEATVDLVERRRRRGAFLTIARSQLALRNTEVFLGDVQQLKDKKYGAITALAFGTLDKIYSVTRHLHCEEIIILSRKSAGWVLELEQLEERLGTKATMTKEEPLETHGRLITVQVPGGIAYR
jgi:16S rRNA (guanine527-N7)-methyltransferase